MSPKLVHLSDAVARKLDARRKKRGESYSEAIEHYMDKEEERQREMRQDRRRAQEKAHDDLKEQGAAR